MAVRECQQVRRVARGQPQLCQAPIRDSAEVCHACGRRVAGQLRELPGLAAAVVDTIARLDRHGTGGRSASEPLPVNLEASQRLVEVTGVVVGWVRQWALVHRVPGRLVAEFAGPVCDGPCRHRSCWVRPGPVCEDLDGCRHPGCWSRRVAATGGWTLRLAALCLAAQWNWLRYRDGAVSELGRAVARIRRAVDSPVGKRYLGPCAVELEVGVYCEGELYARVDAEHATCRLCGIEHEVSDREAWIDREARGRSYSPRVIQEAYGVPAGTIRSWASRGRLAKRGTDERGRDTYSLQEVLDLAAAEAARRAEQQAKRRRRADRRKRDQEEEARAS